MSELNLTRKTFLEVEELNRFQDFLQDGIATNTIVANTRQFGIIQTNFVSADTNFQVSQGTASGTIQFAKARSQALQADGRLIRLEATDNIAVTDDSNFYWVRISHVFRRYEIGTVNINTNGQMTGLADASGAGTFFSQVLRGQATDVPVRIKFQNLDGTDATNNGTYEVVNVIDDTNAVLTSTVGFQAETDLRYIVIGSTPIGEVVSPSQLEGIYRYDSCLVELVAETTVDTPPALPANGAGRYFYVARVMNTGGTVTIQDQRDIDDTYWKFDVPGIQGAIIVQPVPAPTATSQWLYIGRISFFYTNFVRLIWQGCGQNDGTIVEIRFALVLEGGSSDRLERIDTVISGDPVNRPKFYLRVNTDTLTYDLYAQSNTASSPFPFLPGYIALIGENLAPGGVGWEFASSFTWSNTSPPSPVIFDSRFAVYSNNAEIEDVNDQLSALTANVATNVTNITENTSDIDTNTTNIATNTASVGAIETSLTPVLLNLTGAIETHVTDSDINIVQTGNVVVASGFFVHDGTDGVTTIFTIPSGGVIDLTTIENVYGYASDSNDQGSNLQLVIGTSPLTNHVATINEAIDGRMHYFNMTWVIQ